MTETNELEAFLADAMLANKSFASERNSRVIEIHQDEEHQLGETGEPDQDSALRVHLSTVAELPEEPPKFDHRNLPIPRRPPWTREMSAEDVDKNEKAAFLSWRRGIADLEAHNPGLHVSPFEKNLDFWRQLWRVVERSDLVVQVVDARNPLLFRCQDVESMTWDSGKHKMNLLLVNKADFLSEEMRRQWKSYFAEHGIHFLFFSAKTEIERNEERSRRQRKGLDLGDLAVEDDGVTSQDNLETETIQDIVHSTETIISRAKLSRTLERLAAAAKRRQGPQECAKESSASSSKATVGMIGYPNVGKSSVINALFQVTSTDHSVQRVSVSATPGHTKHFQTLHLSKDTILCDCPGLVFPTFMSTKAELICNGILPIDEIRGRDFFPAIELLGRCIDRKTFQDIYGLRPPLAETINQIPAQMLIEEFCEKRGLHAQGHGRYNEAMGARILLKDFVKGKLAFCVSPPCSTNDLDQTSESLQAQAPVPPSSEANVSMTQDVQMTEEELALLMNEDQLLFSESLKIDDKVAQEHAKPNRKKQTKHQRRKHRPDNPYGNGDYFEARTTGKHQKGGFTRVQAPYKSTLN